MPLVSIPTKIRDRAIELDRKARETDSVWDVAYRHGFFEGLRCLLPSETVGMIVMDCDCAAEGEELFTETLPRLVIAEPGAKEVTSG